MRDARVDMRGSATAGSGFVEAPAVSDRASRPGRLLIAESRMRWREGPSPPPPGPSDAWWPQSACRYRPAEAGQLACRCDGAEGAALVTLRVQTDPAAMKARLGAPGDRADRLGLTLLAPAPPTAFARDPAIVPGGLDHRGHLGLEALAGHQQGIDRPDAVEQDRLGHRLGQLHPPQPVEVALAPVGPAS